MPRPVRWLIAAVAAASLIVPAVASARPPAPAGCATADATLISAVQGPGPASPLDGSVVTVRGVLTGVFPDLSGVFVQEEPQDTDRDPATSEGLFAFTGSRDLTGFEPGDRVAVTGRVDEFFGLTELTDVSALVDCDDPGARRIAPTVLHLPADTAAREAHEGMLVSAADLTVTDLFGPFRFGEIGLSGDGVLTQPTQAFAPDDPRAARLAEANAANLLVVDDRGEFGFAAAPWLDDESPRAGDRVPRVVGPLTFTFGEYKIEPLADPRIIELTDRPAAPQLDAEGPRVATFNVLNLFNGDGQGGGFPTPRGARTQADYLDQRDGIVQAIRGLDAVVVGLMEIENDYGDGADSSIAQLVDALNAAGPEPWAYVDPGVPALGPDAIAVGIVYRSDLATEVGSAATFDIDRFLDDDKNRWPLAQSFAIGDEVVTLVVNHLKSKGSSCHGVSTVDGFDAPYAFDADPSTPLEASCNLTRVYAAHQLMEWVATAPTGVADDDYLIGGDLNAYAQEDPIRVLEDAGWTDLVETLGGDQSTFAFDGRYGRLDYLLASPSAVGDIADADVWSINSPEPYGFLYFNLDEQGVYASSDHDPVVVAYPS